MLPRELEPKVGQALHIRTQPGAGTLEAGLRRLRVAFSEQNPGAGPPDFFPWAPEYLGPKRASPSPVMAGSVQLAATVDATTQHPGPSSSARIPLL